MRNTCNRTSRLVKYNLVHDMLTKYAHTPDGLQSACLQKVKK